MYRSLPVLSLLAAASAVPLQARQLSSSCFPYGDAMLPADYSAPSVPRDQWWCPQEQQYGFQGFSYPLEDPDCSADSNSFEKISADFAAMKKDFGAAMVRAYLPSCTEPSIFENLLKAGVANNMAVIPQIWFGFDGDNSVWQASQAALYSVMDSTDLGPVAPYVFHSADFGSEPIGDGVDGDNFLSDLAAFRSRMNGYGVPAGISEDWDRPGKMSADGDGSGSGLGDVGSQVRENSDFAHAHVMPFYHGNVGVGETWGYIEGQLKFYNETVGLPTMVTESQWAWGKNDHSPDHIDVGVEQYTTYWQNFDDNCELFRDLGIGWFIHTWSGEGTFDMRKEDGSYVMEGFRPRKC